MTLSTDRIAETIVDQLVIDSYELAGLWNPAWGTSTPTYQAKVLSGRRKLQSILGAIPTDGVPTKSVYMYDLSLTASDYTYDLPAGTLRVVGDGAYMAAAETDLTKASAEYPVREISRERWQGIGAKDTTGRPTMYWQDMSGTAIELNLWPIPDEAGTIRFQLQRRFTSVLDGSVTLELPIVWESYLRFRLAYEITLSTPSVPLERSDRLRGESDRLRKAAKAFSHQSVEAHMALDYFPRWR